MGKETEKSKGKVENLKKKNFFNSKKRGQRKQNYWFNFS
jgi:hypothetical protein